MTSTWRWDAACATVDPDIWHPENGGNASAAKVVCAGCPVIVQCAADVLGTAAEEHGVRAGLSSRQWRPVRRAAASGVPVGVLAKRVAAGTVAAHSGKSPYKSHSVPVREWAA